MSTTAATAVANALLVEFDSLYDAFEAADQRRGGALEEIDIDDDAPRRDRHGRSRQCLGPVRRRDRLRRSGVHGPNGVDDDVKAALEAAEGNGEVPRRRRPRGRLRRLARVPHQGPRAQLQDGGRPARSRRGAPREASRPPAAPVGSTATATRTTSSRSRSFSTPSTFETREIRHPRLRELGPTHPAGVRTRRPLPGV